MDPKKPNVPAKKDDKPADPKPTIMPGQPGMTAGPSSGAGAAEAPRDPYDELVQRCIDIEVARMLEREAAQKAAAQKDAEQKAAEQSKK